MEEVKEKKDVEVKEEVEEVEEVETEVAENTTEEIKTETFNIEELLKNDKSFASEYDRRVTKAIMTAKEKWQKEYEDKFAQEMQTFTLESETKFNEQLSEYQKEIDSYKGKENLYESKIFALGKGVKIEELDDVITLANTYVNEENDIQKAIDTVINKYPVFANEQKVIKIGKEMTSPNAKGKTLAQEYLEKTRKKLF